MGGKGSGYHGHSREHGLHRKGISTKIDEHRRFDVSHFVARGEITAEQREKAQKEQEEMIKRQQEVEDNYYVYLHNEMKKSDNERILHKSDWDSETLKSIINFGKNIQNLDIIFYEHDRHLQKLTMEEYREIQNLYASDPRIIRPIHVKLAKKGWVSLYDGYFDAVQPSYRAWNPNVMADLDQDKRSYVMVN